MYDTLLAMNELWLQQGAALVISKIYASVAAMEADTAPVSDLTGKPLRPGQIVVIASSDSDNGSVYRYNATDSPSWSLVGNIGNLEPVDSLDSDSTQLPLAAHQGKVLDGKISQLGQEVTDNKNQLDAKLASNEETFHATTDDDTFYVTDKNGYVVAKIDGNGLTDVNTDSTRIILQNLVNNNDEIRSAFNAYDDNVFYICDNDGNIAFSINKNGDINHKTIRSDERGGEFYITDARGYVALHIDNSGNVNYNGKSDSNIEKKDDGYTPADIVLNIMYGQSLSLGGFIDSGENVSTILQFNTVDNYVMTQFTDEVLASEQSIAEYFGDSFIPSKTGIRTTPIGFANTMIMRLLNAENGINIGFKEGSEPNYNFQMLGINPTYTAGGASWTTCVDPDQLYYKRLLKAIEYGKKIAESNNLTFCVGSVCYMQGENSGDNYHSSTTRKEFHDKLWVLFSNLDYDIKRITGQDNDVEYFTYQLASQASLTYTGGHLDIPLAQLDIALETGGGQGYTLASYPAGYLKAGATLIDRKYIHLGAIMNSLDYANQNDHIHCTNNSYATVGAEFGVWIKRAVYDQETPKIIYPKSHKVIQRDTDWLLVLDMDVPVRPLVFDTEHKECQSQRATSANYGFSILNGETEIITGVYLRRGQEICIACSANPTGLNLTYAKDGWEIGGNLRDSQNIPFTINGFNNVIHNWCPTFEITI